MALTLGVSASTETATATLLARQSTAPAFPGAVTDPALRDFVVGQCQAAYPYSRADSGPEPAGTSPSQPVDAVAYHMPGIPTLSRLKLTGDYDPETQRQATHLVGAVLTHLRDDAPLTAHRLLESSSTIDQLSMEDRAALRLRVAAGLLYDGEDEQALKLTELSLDGAKSEEGDWIAGLAAYRRQEFTKAAAHFTAMYAAAEGDKWSSSAAAFWTGRASAKAGDSVQARAWFAKAAPAKTTFYGMMAARALNANDPKDYDPASWPIPRWKPQGGFTVDRALIYAIARQESRFDPKAESDSGAIGLMQLMPETAKAVSTYKDGVEEALYNPETNLELGQRYVHALLTHADIGGNLITMAVAYNGGPGNLARWRKAMKTENDPLLFLETLPAGETRGFIEQVLTNYWIYRIRLGESTESLSDLSAGKWPRYKAPNAQPIVVALFQTASN